MPRQRLDIDTTEVIRKYKQGTSLNKIAKQHNTDRGVIKRLLENVGVPIRTIKESSILHTSQLTADEKYRKTVAAHEVNKGKKHSETHRNKIALSREMSWERSTSFLEIAIGDCLRNMGIEFVYQKAVGRYNIDIFIPSSNIGIEVFGGNWHATGRHLSRFEERSNYLFSKDISQVIVWVTLSHSEFLPEKIARYIKELSTSLKTDKATPRHYVIRGDGNTTNTNSHVLKYNL
jgi:G:T-mismatch repair DNA endonuclease (very short patch repair protein)